MVQLEVLAATVTLSNPSDQARRVTVTADFGNDEIAIGTLATEVAARGTKSVVIPTGDPADGRYGHGACSISAHFEP
jgi:hypothetical protein